MLYKLYLTNLASTWSEWMNEWMNETFIYLKFTTFINDKYWEMWASPPFMINLKLILECMHEMYVNEWINITCY